LYGLPEIGEIDILILVPTWDYQTSLFDSDRKYCLLSAIAIHLAVFFNHLINNIDNRK
jgi:hypothetical protein